MTLARLRVELADRDYPAALALLAEVPEIVETQFLVRPRTLMAARVHSLIGNTAAARVNSDSARVLIEQKLATSPDDQRLYSALGLALAGLGRHADAITAAKQGLAIMPVHREAWKGLFGHEALARIYVAARDYESAMDELEIIVSRPALLEGPPLRLDPCWDPLRESARFEALVRASEAPLAAPVGSVAAGSPANRLSAR